MTPPPQKPKKPSETRKDDGYPSAFIRLIHLYGLVALALTQPLFAVMKRNAEFFVAHRVSSFDLSLLILATSFGLPILLFCAECLFGLIRRSTAKWSHYLFCSLLLATALITPINKISVLPALLAIGLATTVGAMTTILYARSATIRSAFTLVSMLSLIVPIIFAASPNIRKILIPHRSGNEHDTEIKNPVPIVFLMFDEFMSVPLLDANMNIDDVRFPHIAGLAGNSYWFPNASTAHPYTQYSIPAILSGIRPDIERRLPVLGDFPNNLFTLLQGQYRIYAKEKVTVLCPDEINLYFRNAGNLKSPKILVLRDLGIIYFHIILPQSLAEKLPPIDSDWTHFGGKPDQGSVVLSHTNEKPGAQTESGGGKGAADTLESRIDLGAAWAESRSVRPADVDDFINSIEKTPEPMLYYMHVMLPHSPYDYLPTGQVYAPPRSVDGLLAGAIWADDPVLVDLQYQRYLLQIGYVDTVIGQIVSKMKEVGIFDESIIVMVADHGAQFSPGKPHRTLDENNFQQILPVPMIIKIPHQKQGVRDERYAETIDVLPTLADALKIELPWDVDGFSLLKEDGFPVRQVKRIQLDKNKVMQFRFDDIVSFPDHKERLQEFGSKQSLDDLSLKGNLPGVIGSELDALQFREDPDISFEIDQIDDLRNVDLNGNFIPLYVSGRINAGGEQTADKQIALVLNGTVVAVTNPARSLKGGIRFRSVLPRSALQDGANQIQAFIIEEHPTGSFNLAGSREIADAHVIYDLAGKPLKIAMGSREFTITKGSPAGSIIEPSPLDDNYAEVYGWAIDERKGSPAKQILLFFDDKFFASIPVNVNRPDISDWKGHQYLASGFAKSLRVLPLIGKEISAYAVTQDGRASELNYLHRNTGSFTSTANLRPFVYTGSKFITLDGAEHIMLLNGRRVIARSTPVSGEIRRTENPSNFIDIHGWAVDGATGEVPRAILIFHDEDLIRQTRPVLTISESQIQHLTGIQPKAGFQCSVTTTALIQSPSPSDDKSGAKLLTACAVFADETFVRLPWVDNLSLHLSPDTGNSRSSEIRDVVTSLSLTQFENSFSRANSNVIIQGAVEPVIFAGDRVRINGWAIDITARKPAETIALFSGERCIARLQINIPRPDIASWKGKQFLLCGFSVEIRREDLDGGDLSAFAIAEGVAGKLNLVSASTDSNPAPSKRTPKADPADEK